MDTFYPQFFLPLLPYALQLRRRLIKIIKSSEYVISGKAVGIPAEKST